MCEIMASLFLVSQAIIRFEKSFCLFCESQKSSVNPRIFDTVNSQVSVGLKHSV